MVGELGNQRHRRAHAHQDLAIDPRHVVGAQRQQRLQAGSLALAFEGDDGCHDLTIVHDLAQPLPAGLGTFDHVATNPPYLAAAVADPSPDPSKALATVESSADLARWLQVATGALKPAGTLTIIHRNDRLDEIADHLARLGWGQLTLKLLLPAQRVLVQAHCAAS